MVQTSPSSRAAAEKEARVQRKPRQSGRSLGGRVGAAIPVDPSNPRRAAARTWAGQGRRALLTALGAWGAATWLSGCGESPADGAAVDTSDGADFEHTRNRAPQARPSQQAGDPVGDAVPARNSPPTAGEMAPPTAQAPFGPGATAPRFACARATSFPPVSDPGPRAEFSSTAETDTNDWIVQGLASALYQTSMPTTLIALLESLGLMHLGYPLNLLDHSLQTATRARRAGASDDLVLAALLHRLGLTLTIENYAEVSAAIVRGFLSEDAYRVVRHHPEYALQHYGAQIEQPTGLRARYLGESFHADAVRFADEWQRPSFDPAYDSLSLSDFAPLLQSRFSSIPSALYLTQRDCF